MGSSSWLLRLGAGPVLQKSGTSESKPAQNLLDIISCSILVNLVNTMASEPQPEPALQAAAATTAADKPPLVCAPCWICLEDGPDETGEPLIRDCACRGETSAGYHLSCIIKHATVKTDQVLMKASVRDIYNEIESDLINYWKRCENCCQPYSKSICTLMGQACVQFTEDRNLLNTNCLRFAARVFFAEALLYRHQYKEDIVEARDQIKFLLQFVQENCDTLAAAWWGDQDEGELLKEFHTGKLLLLLGRTHKLFGNVLKAENGPGTPADDRYNSALLCFENALKNFNCAASRGMSIASEIQDTEGFIKDIKIRLGLISVDQRIEDFRKELKDSENNGTDCWSIVSCKGKLIDALLEKDPPEYFEAIKLKSEIYSLMERALGADYEIVMRTKHDLSNLKREYRNFLKSLKQSSS